MANNKPIQMGRNRGMGPKPKLDHPMKTFFRLIKYSYGRYPIPSIIVFICIMSFFDIIKFKFIL